MDTIRPATCLISAVGCDSAKARRLLTALDEDLLHRYPGNAIHGLHPGEGDDRRLAFLVARVDGRPAGCAEIPAFGEYAGNPFSFCVEKSLASPE